MNKDVIRALHVVVLAMGASNLIAFAATLPWWLLLFALTVFGLAWFLTYTLIVKWREHGNETKGAMVGTNSNAKMSM